MLWPPVGVYPPTMTGRCSTSLQDLLACNTTCIIGCVWNLSKCTTHTQHSCPHAPQKHTTYTQHWFGDCCELCLWCLETLTLSFPSERRKICAGVKSLIKVDFHCVCQITHSDHFSWAQCNESQAAGTPANVDNQLRDVVLQKQWNIWWKQPVLWNVKTGTVQPPVTDPSRRGQPPQTFN